MQDGGLFGIRRRDARWRRGSGWHSRARHRFEKPSDRKIAAVEAAILAPDCSRFPLTIGPITSARQAWTKVPSPESLMLTFGHCASCSQLSVALIVSGPPPTRSQHARHVRARTRCPGKPAPASRRPSFVKRRSAIRTGGRDRRARQGRDASLLVVFISRVHSRANAVAAGCPGGAGTAA